MVRWASHWRYWRCSTIFVWFACSFWWMKRRGWYGLRGKPSHWRCLNMEDAWTCVSIGVKLLMDEALRVIWPEGESHRIEDAWTWKMLEHVCRLGWSFWWMKRCGWYGLRERAMLNLNGRCGPTGFALKILKMLEHFCLICVQLLMDEAACVMWPEGKSHRIEDAWTWKMLEHVCRLGWSFWWMKRCGWYGLRERAMLNLNGRCGPAGFALKILKMLEHFCLIRVQLLMDEAAWVIWPEGKSHRIEDAWTWKMLEHVCRLGWSFWWMKRCGWYGLRERAMLNLNGRCGPTGFALKILKMFEHFCLICVQLLMDEAAWVIWPEGKSHRIEDAWTWKMLEHVCRLGWSFWWMKRCGWYGLRGRAMLNLNGRCGPAGFALKILKMLEHFCRIWVIWVKLLMDAALRAIWPDGKSHSSCTWQKSSARSSIAGFRSLPLRLHSIAMLFATHRLHWSSLISPVGVWNGVVSWRFYAGIHRQDHSQLCLAWNQGVSAPWPSDALVLVGSSACRFALSGTQGSKGRGKIWKNVERLQLAKTYFATWTEKNRFSQQPMQKHVWFIQLLHVACWCMIGFEVWVSSVQCSSWQLRECTVIVCKILQRTVVCGPGTIYCRYRGPSKPTLATIFAVFFLRWQGQVQNPEWRLVKGVRGIGGIRPFLSQVFNCHIDLFDHGRVNTTSNHSGCLSFSRNHLFRMTIVNICQHCQHLSAHVQLCKALDGSFGSPVDGFLGRTPQANAWDSSWPRFWRQRCERLLRGAVQLRPAFRRVLQAATFLVIHIWSACDPHCIHVYHESCVGDYCNTGSQALYMRSCNSCSPVPCSQATNNLEALFEDEPVRPVLLHGDFWNGNFAGTPNGSKWGMHGHAIHAECCTWNAGKILAFGLMSLFAFVVASSLIPAPSSQRGKQRIAKVPTCGYL